uniref:ARAD1B13046p n=1 Tax=Blastobotrys adeninivorans TaxID=409370 RepID=A0A060T5M9_BLAAD
MNRFAQGLYTNASWALRVACTVHLIHWNVYELTDTRGESMLPTLRAAGDYVHVDKLFHSRGRNCKVGDIIVAGKPTDPEQRVCKRITGMPGDVVLVDPSANDYDRFITIPDGHCWVTGDNLHESIDSRTYGPLPLALIRGKVVAIQSGGHFQRITDTD